MFISKKKYNELNDRYTGLLDLHEKLSHLTVCYLDEIEDLKREVNDYKDAIHQLTDEIERAWELHCPEMGEELLLDILETKDDVLSTLRMYEHDQAGK